MKRLASFGVATLAILGLSLTAASPALAHDTVTGYDFTKNADGAATGFVLNFNNDLMSVGGGNEILIEDPSGKSVVEGLPQVDGRAVTQAVKAPLAPGDAYKVTWRVVSSDGHPIQGIYFFEVDANGAASVVKEGAGETSSTNSESSESSEGSDEQTSSPSSQNTDSHTQRSDSSFPAGGWIALGAVVVIGFGAVALLAARGRKKRAGAANAEVIDQKDSDI